MSVRGWQSKFIANPRGMWTAVAQKKTGNPARASAVQNCRISPGVMATRSGTTPVFASTGAVASMFNWITPAGVNLVLYKDGDTVKCFNQATSAITTLMTGLNGAVQICFADLDVWVYFCGYNALGLGTFQARIFDGTNVDIAFRGPLVLTSATATDAGPGYSTAGTHYFGFVYQNRTGYAGVPVTSTTYAITATHSVSFAVTATTNASPDVLSVPGHTFTNGETVTGAGATGDTAINGVFLVTNVIGGTSLQLTDRSGNVIAGNGVYTGGGTLTAPDLITATGNSLVTGNTMSIAGALGDTAINGSFTATVVTPGSTFTLTNNASGNPVNSTGAYGGSGVLTVPFQITIPGGFAITSTAGVQYSVSAATNANPTVLTVPGHTFVNGNLVTGAGATGNTAINGVFLVANVAGNTLELTDGFGNLVAGNGVYISGGTLTGPDLIKAPGNNFVTGNGITVAGATGDTAINGFFTVQVVGNASTFILLNGSTPVNSNGAYTGGGIATGPTLNSQQIDISAVVPAQTDGGPDANGGVLATLFLIATPANNPSNWFFIPNDTQTGQIGEQPVPYNTPATLNFVMNISDFDINASLVGADGLGDANPNFLFLSQDSNGNGPFFPSFVSVYGLRMVYGDGTIAYASELDNPQQISADLNQIILPNQRLIGMGFQLPNSSSFYLTGDRWTAYVTDNSDSPSTWAPPVSVSSAIGAPYPHCVCSATGNNAAWIATEPGIYPFDGTYADLPLTYLISDLWTGVNWNAASLFEMADDVGNLKLYVTVAYNPALPNTPSQILVFDYQNGRNYDSCDISVDLFTSTPAIAAVGSICAIRELSGSSNLWIGQAAAGNVVRYNPGGAKTDQGNPINSFWISGLFLGTGEMTSQMIRVGQADIWVRGSGTCAGPNWYGPDNVQTVSSYLQINAGVPVPMMSTPGVMYQTRLDFRQIENFQFGIGAGIAPGDWFSLSGFRPYYKPDLYNR